MRAEIFAAITEASEATPVAFLRVHKDDFWQASEWDVLVSDLQSASFSKDLIVSLLSQPKRLTPIFEYHSKLSCKITIFEGDPSNGKKITLDIRGPVIKNGRIFIGQRNLSSITNTGLHFLKNRSERYLLLERNRADGRQESRKHRKIFSSEDQVQDSFKASLGSLVDWRPLVENDDPMRSVPGGAGENYLVHPFDFGETV